jgi:hypothetical protein
MARCLVLDDGTERIAIVIVDSLMIPRSLLDEAKKMVQTATGVPTDRRKPPGVVTDVASTACSNAI